MRKPSDNLSLSIIDRARDRVVSSLLRVAMPTADSPQDPGLTVGSTSYKILEGLAGLCGFDRFQVESVLREGAGRRALWNLLKSLSDYGVGTPQTLRAPVSVVWSLSYRCNLRCMHCYQNASHASSDELTLEEQLGIVDQMGQAGVSMVVLSGGEPLTNPNLAKLIERIRTYDIAISIDSNGVLMSREVVQSLKHAGVASVELSLDSIDPATHDRFRGLDGALEKTLNALDLCAEAGIFTTVANTATTLNYADSRKLVELARSHGAGRVIFFDLIPTGRGREIGELRLSRSQLIELMALVKEQSMRNEIEVFTELPQFVIYSSAGDEQSSSDQGQKPLSIERFTVSTFFDCAGRNNAYRRFAPYLGGCPAGRIYCNIQPNGDVTPCMFMPQYPIAGNLRKQPLEEIWRSETFQALRDRTRLKGKCRECKFMIVCGGCRAKAAAYNGDYLASDPTCPIYD
jgi:radical SAM protein with 4Fe4S-binding SPASM domain